MTRETSHRTPEEYWRDLGAEMEEFLENQPPKECVLSKDEIQRLCDCADTSDLAEYLKRSTTLRYQLWLDITAWRAFRWDRSRDFSPKETVDQIVSLRQQIKKLDKSLHEFLYNKGAEGYVNDHFDTWVQHCGTLKLMISTLKGYEDSPDSKKAKAGRRSDHHADFVKRVETALRKHGFSLTYNISGDARAKRRVRFLQELLKCAGDSITDRTALTLIGKICSLETDEAA